jgi:hypothetical protein
MSDYFENAYNKINLFQKDVLNKIFPKAHFKETCLFGKPDKRLKEFQGFISTERLFQCTNYDFEKDNKLFIHFTSLSTLSQILNSGFLRMSEFNCLQDKTELVFASEVLSALSNNEREKIEKERSKLFCLSACKSNSETLQNKFMWHHYSTRETGCVIEYKFTQLDIHNMIFGQVRYGKYSLKELKSLKELAQTFQKKYDFTVKEFPLFLLKISAFHKQIQYKKEQEVRLLLYNDGSIGTNAGHINQYKDFYKDNHVRNFIKLPIKGKNPYFNHPDFDIYTVLKHSPQIEITRIIIGSKNTNLIETIEYLNHLQEHNNIHFEIWHKNQHDVIYKIE